jgi:type II secretory pathway component PulF
LLARVGQDTGRMAHALRMAGVARSARVNAWVGFVSRFTYLLWLITVAESISGFLLYFTVPRFEAIFADFGVPLPGLTIFMIEGSHFLVRYGFITALLFLFQVLLLIFLPFSYGGWVNYQVPFFDRLFARRHTALVLRSLSLVIDAGRPIGVGLEVLARRYPARWVRRRLAAAERAVRGGDDWIRALWKAGVIRRSDAELLASAATVGNLAWACRELADTAERRQQVRLQLVMQMLFPLAILAVGVAIAVLCLGYFLPLVTLIQRLTTP